MLSRINWRGCLHRDGRLVPAARAGGQTGVLEEPVVSQPPPFFGGKTVLSREPALIDEVNRRPTPPCGSG